jgi:hypothetical protein
LDTPYSVRSELNVGASLPTETNSTSHQERSWSGAVMPSAEERAALVRLANLLHEGGGRSMALVRGGTEAELPRSVREVLTRVADVLASGRGLASHQWTAS